MPFQSEKQRRFLHANHPEIAKRWEKEYAHGGISNHFRKKYSLGEGPVMEETDNMDFLSSLTQEEVDQEPEKYAQLLIGLRKPDFFMGEGANQRAYFIQPDNSRISVPWGFFASSYEQTVDFKNGGISNHFRRKFAEGSWDPGVGRDTKGYQKSHPSYGGGNGGNGGNGGDHHPPSGPTAEEIAAQKAAEETRLQALENARRNQIYENTMAKRKKNIKYYDENLKSKFDTPTWDTDIAEISLYDKNKTIDDYHNLLDDEKELNFFEKQHLEELDNLERIKFEDQFKEDVEVEDDTPGGYIERENRKFQKLAELTESQKKWINKEKSNLKRGFKEPQHVFETINNPKLGKFEKNTFNLLKGPQEPTTPKEFNDYLKEILPESTLPKVTAVGAKGGVARKNYFHGGILDINESEEIISDDGNDIELTAYNAEFDDPNDLSTGVKTLFMKKGGNVRLGPHTATDLLAKKNPDGTRSKYQPPGGGATSLGSGRDYSGSDRGPRDDPDRFGPTTTTTPSGKDIHPPTSPKDQWDPGAGAPQHIPAPRIGVSLHGGPKFKYTKELVDKNRKMAKDKYEEHIKEIQNKYGKSFVKKVGWSLITKTFDFGLSDLWNAGVVAYKLNKAKKDYMGILENAKSKYQELGLPEFNPHVDTDIQEINQEILNLTQRPDDEDDTKGDGPEVPKVVPVHQEIEEYEGTYAMSPWDRIKANQAKRAVLVEKGIIQDNPVVDESVTDITMQANSGGLANLFRVKNQ